MPDGFEVIPPNTGYLHHYPAVGFHFRVTFSDYKKADGSPVNDPKDDCDARFQSVIGLSVEVETETKKEGGENRFEHVLPLRTKYPPLVLKRGLVKGKDLRKWITGNINGIANKAHEATSERLISPRDIKIDLLGPETDEILMSWNIVHAWPKKWSVSDLNAEQGSIIVESIELQYQYFTINDNVNAH